MCQKPAAPLRITAWRSPVASSNPHGSTRWHSCRLHAQEVLTEQRQSQRDEYTSACDEPRQRLIEVTTIGQLTGGWI